MSAVSLESPIHASIQNAVHLPQRGHLVLHHNNMPIQEEKGQLHCVKTSPKGSHMTDNRNVSKSPLSIPFQNRERAPGYSLYHMAFHTVIPTMVYVTCLSM